MTSVLLEQIEREEEEEEKKREREREREECESWASESSVAKYYVTAEQRDGRRDLWAESKVNNYNIVTHFFGEWLKEDHLSHLIGNFLCLMRIISHAVAFDGVVRRGRRRSRKKKKKGGERGREREIAE